MTDKRDRKQKGQWPMEAWGGLDILEDRGKGIAATTVGSPCQAILVRDGHSAS